MSKDFFGNKGYTILRQLRGGDRFHAYLGEKGGVRYFLKFVSPSVLSEQREKLMLRLARQVRFYELINSLDELKPSIVCPVVYESGSDWYVSSVFEEAFYPDLSELTDLHRLDEERLAKGIPTFVSLLVTLDRTMMAHQPKECAPKELSERMNNWIWLKKGIEAGAIDKTVVQRAKTLIGQYQPYVTACLQHTDFVPSHLFRLADGKIGLVDAENADFANPRFYDLAELYARLFVLTKHRGQCARLLHLFIDEIHAEPEAFRRQFIPVLTLRAVGMLTDAYAHKQDGEAEYEQDALDLLELCLAEKLDMLTSTPAYNLPVDS